MITGHALPGELTLPEASCRESSLSRLEQYHIRSHSPQQAAGNVLTPEFSIRLSALILIVVGVFACAVPPRTVQEFRVESKGGGESIRIDRHEIDRPFLVVFQDIRDNATKCLNPKVAGSAAGDPASRQLPVRYRSYTKKISSKSAEMVLQSDKQGPGKMPEGGYYTMLADIEAVAAQRTRVTITGPSMLYGDVFDAVTAWARGKARICPSLP